MKAEELRIGNYYQWSEFASMGLPGPQQITHGQQIMDYIDLKKGIPLTEEWLVKFGFKKEEDVIDFIIPLPIGNGLDLDVEFEKDQQYQEVCLRNSTDDFMYLKQIRYVHHLQNLFFALTGEELKISNT